MINSIITDHGWEVQNKQKNNYHENYWIEWKNICIARLN